MEFLMRWGFLHRLFGGPREESRSAAKDRLRNALVGDRCTVAPALMECMSADLLAVLRKYLVVQEKDLKVSICERDGGMKFTAGVGVVRVLRQAQLPAAALAEGAPERSRRHKLRGPRRRSSED
jgi:cell division topological specificity factor MinE